MNLYTTTNQKQSAATEGTTEGKRNEREARGSAISLFYVKSDTFPTIWVLVDIFFFSLKCRFNLYN